MKSENPGQSWQNYQKNIADDHYYYVRSCIRQTFFPGSETALLNILRNNLGKDVMDDPGIHPAAGLDIIPILFRFRPL